MAQFASSHIISESKLSDLRCDAVESVATLPLRDEQTAVVMSSFWVVGNSQVSFGFD
jgi:hypothetical protein